MKHFNRESFFQTIDNDVELFSEILEDLKFLEWIQEYQTAIANGSLKTTFCINHRIKGTAKNIFFERLIFLCEEAERDLKAEKMPPKEKTDAIFDELKALNSLLHG